MKVLFITNKFPEQVCGVGDYTFHLQTEFNKNGNQTYVLTKSHSKNLDWPNIYTTPVWGFFSMFSLLRIIRKINPDAILFQYVPYSYNNKGIPFWLIPFYFLLKINGYKVLTTFHEVAIRLKRNSPKSIFFATCQHIIAFFISKLSVMNITSIALYEQYLRRYTRNVSRCPIGSNIVDESISEEDINSLKQQIAMRGEFVLCTFGTRISSSIVDLLGRILTKYDVKLLLLGKISSEAQNEILERAKQLKINNHLIIPGYLPSQKLFLYMKTASVFLLYEYVSPNGEGGVCAKSGALAAGYAAGLPILGTKGDVTDEIFVDGQNIFFCDYNYESAEEKLKYLLSNPQELETVRRNASIFYQQTLSWNVIYKCYQSLLDLSLGR